MQKISLYIELLKLKIMHIHNIKNAWAELSFTNEEKIHHYNQYLKSSWKLLLLTMP
jgi:hypothetical protein